MGMSCLGPVFNALKSPVSLRLSCSKPFFTARVSRRAFSITTNSHNDLFEYTSGRWVYNDALRHKERRLAFDVDGLCRLAAESVNQSPANIVNLTKLAEGGFNRSFLITLRDDSQIVARIPYPMTVPKFYAVASEAATLEFLRSSGLPVPKVYGYSPDPDNAAGTEYIFMQYVQGTNLGDIWPIISDEEVVSVLRQLAQIESSMMALSFPAGGSLYFSKDLEKVSAGPGIPLEDKRFCVGPDTRIPLWFGRRSMLDVDRGPYLSAEAALVAGARKELEYLKRFGQPVLPFERMRRGAYEYQEQSPLPHIDNLNRFLLVALSVVPKDPALNRFCIRHPDLNQSNIMVSKSPGSGCEIVGLIDWQHASVLPMFLNVGVPQRLQNYNDPVSQSMIPPSLPENFDELEGDERTSAEVVYRDRLTHYHYVKNMEPSHFTAFADPMWPIRGRLFQHSGRMWEGETLELKLALIEAIENWNALTGGGSSCLIEFNAEEVREAKKLEETQSEADGIVTKLHNGIGLGEDGWISNEGYENVMALLKGFKEQALAGAASQEEREQLLNHWPWDDMDEEKYM